MLALVGLVISMLSYDMKPVTAVNTCDELDQAVCIYMYMLLHC